MDKLLVMIFLILGCLTGLGYGTWLVYLALSCRNMVNATLMKIEYITTPRRGYGCRLHFHVKGNQAKKYIVDHVSYWVGNSMKKHKKYNIFVSANEKHALLDRWKALLSGVVLIGLGIFGTIYICC